MAFSSAVAREWPRTSVGASVTFSSTLMWGKRLKLWKTMPTSRRRRFTSTPGPEIRSSASLISPPWMVSSPLMQRSSVDFPQPDGPMRHTTWCSSTERLAPFSTASGPKNFTTSRISRKDIALAAAAHAPLVPLEQTVDEAGLGDGDEHEEDRED